MLSYRCIQRMSALSDTANCARTRPLAFMYSINLPTISGASASARLTKGGS